MKKTGPFARRSFIGAGLVTAGAGMGWLARRFQGGPGSSRARSQPANRSAVYDVSEFERTDPALLLYQPTTRFETGFKNVKRLQTAPGNQLMVAGDRSIRFFTPSGTPGPEIRFDRPPHCMQWINQDELVVGLGNCFAVHDRDGREKFRSPRLGERAFLTAVTAHHNTLYLADAGSREILIADLETGEVTGRFGKKDPARNNPGFAVPSPYFDLTLAPPRPAPQVPSLSPSPPSQEHRLHIVNPGRLRVETYTLDGRFVSAWGQPGLMIDRFCGCCNPVYFTTTPDGSFVTSEKGLARVNVYSSDGRFLGAVAGPDTLVDDKELAKRACMDCSVGAGFDVAVGDNGAIHVLDPFRKSVRTFVPKAKT